MLPWVALLEPVVTKLSKNSNLLDLVGTKLYCFRARVHRYHCLYIIFSVNPVRRSVELRGEPLGHSPPFTYLN